MTRAFVLGAAAVDTLAYVDAFPGPDMIVGAEKVLRAPGGSSANVAVALSRLGVPTGFLGCVGDDADGALTREALLQEGVDVSGLKTVAGGRTNAVFITVDKNGARVMVALGGESVYTEAAQLDGLSLAGDLLYIGEAFSEVGTIAAQRMHAAGGQVAFGPGGVMCGYGLDALLPLIKAADLLFVSAPELRLLSGAQDTARGAEILLGAGAGALVLTQGSAGASYITRDETVFAPSKKAARIVDTTGAGDAFTAAFLAARLGGKAPKTCLTFAHRCAAYAIGFSGARTSPHRRDITEDESC